MNLNARALNSFISVADHQSYTKAAATLSLSQPGVHQHVRQLEDRLDTKLVEQHGKSVMLTAHGRVVYQFAKRRRDEERDLVRYLRDDVSLRQGKIRIAAATTAGEFILPTIAVGFQRKYEGVEIVIQIMSSLREVDAGVADGTFDLGMHSYPNAVQGIDKVPFLTDALVGIARPDHLLAQESVPVSPFRLLDEPLVVFSRPNAGPGRGAPSQASVDEWFSSTGEYPTVALTVGTFEGMKRAVRDGGGVAIVSPYAVDPDDAGISKFELSDPPQRDFVLVSRDHGWESNVVRSFREYALGMAWAEGDRRMFHRSAEMHS
jgi:DNA-binding transcriptional LysR family regulator